MSTPLVSILVPCYNGARYIAQLCKSIQRQTFPDFEVLIGDDCSTDNSVDIIQPFLADARFKLFIWKPNRGLHSNIVFLLNAARGRYWCPPGQDDILEPRFLEKRAPRLEGHPEAVLIHGAAAWIDGQGDPYHSGAQTALTTLKSRIPEALPGVRMLRVLLQHNILNWPSTLVRMDLTRRALPFFVPRWIWAMDWVLWILLAASGFDFLWDSESMIRYRMHEGSISGSPQRDSLRRIERKLAPLHALRTASQFSPLANELWLEYRTALYRWWLVTALASRRRGALAQRELLLAHEAYYGDPRTSVSLWREAAIHGLPALLQYRREKQANQHQIFEVAGFSLIDDPLFSRVQ